MLDSTSSIIIKMEKLQKRAWASRTALDGK
jgi:hypothetical protein